MILELWWKSNASDLLTFIDDNLVHLVTHVCWWTHPLFLVAKRLLVFCAIPLFGTFLSGPLNWARFPLLSNSSPLLSAFLSGPLNWALFWAKLLNWALFWANPLVWALFWALKKADLLLRARFWVVLLFWALKKALKRVKPLKIALKKALKLCHNLPPSEVISSIKMFSSEITSKRKLREIVFLSWSLLAKSSRRKVSRIFNSILNDCGESNGRYIQARKSNLSKCRKGEWVSGWEIWC